MKHRGWTLVEMIFVLLFVGIITTLAFSFFIQGQKESRRLDFRLQALQSAFLVRARLADDLASALPAGPGAQAVPCASSITLSRVRATADCGIYGTNLDNNLQPITDNVRYDFDPARHVVLRNGLPISTAHFLDVTFSYLPYTPGVRGETIEIHMTAVPEQLLDDPNRTEFKQQEIISFSFHCSQTSLARAYPDIIVDPPPPPQG